MKYTSGRTFRQALEDRIRKIFYDRDIPLVRLRKQIAFERFLARLIASQPETWVLKGGLAIQLRLGNQARTTKDIDLLKTRHIRQILEPLQDAAAFDLSDWFSFEVEKPVGRDQDVYEGQRYHVNSYLDSRLFESFHVDVGVGDVIVESLEMLTFEPVLSFAGIEPIEVPCYPVTQQIAEKLHALTRMYDSGESTRAKDFVDILLLANSSRIEDRSLLKAIKATFKKRGTHFQPGKAPKFSSAVQREVLRLLRETNLRYNDVVEAEKALEIFLTTIPGSEACNWNPMLWIWEKLTPNFIRKVCTFPPSGKAWIGRFAGALVFVD